ncbi:MAG: PIN domain-containing protein [Candidatus Sumerlaeota bacterium]|nr:PIN domain-containing protein [Candidatus Sumerlaeota bacterium]
MSAWFADSFFFIALLSERDRAHAKAADVLETLETTLLTTEWVLTEVADAMSDPSCRRRCLSFFEFLRPHPLVAVEPASHDLFEQGLRLYGSRFDKDWSLTDCISFVVMRQNGLSEALTGDRHFEQAGFRALFAG